MYFLVCFVIILLRNLESLKSFLFNALTVFNALSIFLKLINFFGCIRSQLRHVGSFVVAWAFHCGTRVSLQLWHVGFSLVVVCRFSLSSCGTWAPGHVGSVVCGTWDLSLSSVVVARRLSCPTACGILVPQPGIEPTSPALDGGFFTTGPPGKSQRAYNLDSVKIIFGSLCVSCQIGFLRTW